MRGNTGILALGVVAIACGTLEGTPSTEGSVDGGATPPAAAADAGGPLAEAGACPVKRCYTFDADPRAPNDSFDQERVDRSGTFGIVTDRPSSPPNALLVKVLGTPGLGAGSAWGVTTIPGTPTTITTTFKMRVGVYDPKLDPSAHFLSIGCPGGWQNELYLKLTDAAVLGLKQYATGGPDPPSEPIPALQDLTPFEVTLVRTAGDAFKLSVKVAGQAHFTQGLPDVVPFGCSPIEMRHGVQASDPASPDAHYELAYDDIFVDWK
jgi:hypothetical protein